MSGSISFNNLLDIPSQPQLFLFGRLLIICDTDSSCISVNLKPFLFSLNILQDSSFSNQITFILHIQGVFNLPGRGFHQRINSTSSVSMTLNDVIVHVKQFVIALVSVDECSSFPDPDGFLDMPDSSVGFLVYTFHSLPVYYEKKHMRHHQKKARE